jgi:hypothetical protein
MLVFLRRVEHAFDVAVRRIPMRANIIGAPLRREDAATPAIICFMVAIGRLVLTSREHIIGLEPLKNGLMGRLLRDDIQDVKSYKGYA